jgi:hypothetical protein
LWEFRFSQSKSSANSGVSKRANLPSSTLNSSDYRVELLRLSTITIRSDDHQPFCLTELRNKPPITEVELNGAKFEDFGDVILGCDSGTIIVLDVKAKSQSIAVVGKMQIQNAQKKLPEVLTEKKVLTMPAKDEPLTHIVECQGKDRHGLVIVSTINGMLFLLNHVDRTLVQKVRLQDISSSFNDTRFNCSLSRRKKQGSAKALQ